MRFTSIYLLCLAFCIFSCSKEHDIITIEEEPFEPATHVEVASLVISLKDNLSFSCKINGQEYFGEDGVLLIEKLLLDKVGNSVLIQAEGYFDEVRYIIPSLGARMYIEVEMS